MEATYARVHQHCALQIKIYSDCIGKHPHDWQTKCLGHKQSLTKCANENVQEIQAIKQLCEGQVAVYQKCMQDNPSNGMKCEEALEQLYQCHERHSAARQ
ncbi:hypothetical protein HDV03_003798 [Kappamyces sp. JEL0829]|nr:hypothetical protein HDV03_003798 [Kappamyces sp. JEL0829]